MFRRSAVLVSLVAFLLAGTAATEALAQAPTPAPAAKPPALTELQKKDVEIASLKQALAFERAQKEVCVGNAAASTYQSTMATISATDLATIRTAYEKANPGWTLTDKMEPVKKGG